MMVAARGLDGLLHRTIRGRGKAIRYRFAVTLPEGQTFGFDQVTPESGRLVFEANGIWHDNGVTADESGMTMAPEHRFPVAVLPFERALLDRPARGDEAATEVRALVPGLVVEGCTPRVPT
ncbi:hypothetical protein [Ruegeria aquimaris]|uniref:Uncharacterized protein n=1 Tax=Ruegeria aquimaris TaxID=2984333 RepID=A0ABT3ADU6_9RHOB|nr:hypothetical protein [Ruegeria sp. XHP0148]MCV2886853.1 hypothetical protein [Ruegeria sp. XHP0148]